VFELAGRVVVITGGYRGIGFGMATGLAGAGAEVVLWARDRERMDGPARDLGATAVECDVTEQGSVEAAMAQTLEAHGRVDVLIANAGMPPDFRWVPEIDLSAWEAIVDVNMTGVYLTTSAAAQHMIARGGGGKLLVISSVRSQIGTAHGPAYSAAKAGAEALVRSLAVGLAEHDIQVNAIRAGWVETEMTDRMRSLGGSLDEAIADAVPARRWGRPEDFAGLAVYFASSASDFHTGDCVTVDGGFGANDPLNPKRWAEGQD
jgi:NAD(P)-dependent dehydrogenase (short-subunit alcohol dehydrogenase family)